MSTALPALPGLPAAVAVCVALGGAWALASPAVRIRLVGRAPRASPTGGPGVPPRSGWGRSSWSPVAGVAVSSGVAAVVVVGGVAVVPGPVAGHLLLGVLVVAGVDQLRRRSRARSGHERATLGAGRACELLVGEVGAGIPPAIALRRVAEQHPALAVVVAAADVGSDVPGALRRLATESGVATWGRVADAWQVSEQGGAALGPVLARVAQAERDETVRRRLVRTELADAVATARLMAALPWVLVGVASLGGGTAATFLLTTWPGFVCAALGSALVAAGLVWIERISSEGTRP